MPSAVSGFVPVQWGTPLFAAVHEHPADACLQPCLLTASLQKSVWTKRPAPKSPDLLAHQE